MNPEALHAWPRRLLTTRQKLPTIAATAKMETSTHGTDHERGSPWLEGSRYHRGENPSGAAVPKPLQSMTAGSAG